MGLALGAASGLVGTGLWVASHPGDGDGVQCPVQRAVTAAVQPMPGALTAACLQRSDSGQGGERCLVADASMVRSADQQLRGDHRADTGLGEKGRPGRMLLDETEQLRVELGKLAGQEPDPCRD